MYENGQLITHDIQFAEHIEKVVPIQIYRDRLHDDIGFVQEITSSYVRMNDTFYRRDQFNFVSRPGY